MLFKVFTVAVLSAALIASLISRTVGAESTIGSILNCLLTVAGVAGSGAVLAVTSSRMVEVTFGT